MIQIGRLFFCFLFLFVSACQSNDRVLYEKDQAKPSAVPVPEVKAGRCLWVYYFFNNARCLTCRKMEKYVKEAVNDFFSDEIENGRVGFKAVNIDEAHNKHFIHDYALYTKSVVLSETKDGREMRWKNLEKIWELVRNEHDFRNYIRDEAALFLKDNK